MPIVYEELSRIARRALNRERTDHTLQTRGLVHEAYLRLMDAEVDWRDRSHFLGIAARSMRQVLTDYARARQRDKRGGDLVRVDLQDDQLAPGTPPIDALALSEALDRLEAHDERKARLIELHYYAGMNYDETAEVLGISAATVGRELRLAKAWLSRELDIRVS